MTDLHPIKTEQTDTHEADVVIVGAGASGLQCSRLLREAGLDVIVLEARPRIGGRVHSVPHKVRHAWTNNRIDVLVDHGAAWVHGLGYDWPSSWKKPLPKPIPERNPMMELLKQVVGDQESLASELRPIFVKGNPWRRPKHCVHQMGQIAIYQEGTVRSDEGEGMNEAFAEFFAIMSKVSDYGNSLYEEGEGMETTRLSLKEVFQKVQESSNDEDNHVLSFLLYMLELWYGAPSSSLQLSEFVRDEEDPKDDSQYTPEGDFLGPHCAVRSGMSRLLEPLCNHGERILLEEEVRRIRNRKGHVLVETKTGSKVRTKACVVTMSIGCLQKNHERIFRPSLDAAQLEAIQSLKMGQYKKVFMTFDKIFWPTDEAFIGLIDPSSSTPLGKNILLDNLWADGGLPCLEAILIGPAATWAFDRLDMTVCYAVLDFMETAMSLQNLRQRCRDFSVTRWEEDPYSLGAYSGFTLGSLERHTEALQEPTWNGKLFFCGEHTVSDYEGSVHAALFSGCRAAAQIKQQLLLSNEKEDSESPVPVSFP